VECVGTYVRDLIESQIVKTHKAECVGTFVRDLIEPQKADPVKRSAWARTYAISLRVPRRMVVVVVMVVWGARGKRV
jgi:hypothetical protein